jgi:hypothetical protein
VEGGCANDYVYGFGDPVNASDLSGKASYQGAKAEGNFGTISAQISPKGYLAWGASPNRPQDAWGYWISRCT